MESVDWRVGSSSTLVAESASSSSSTTFPTTGMRLTISAGPMISGDRKRPNPWNYRVRWARNPSGELGGSRLYPSRPKNSTYYSGGSGAYAGENSYGSMLIPPAPWGTGTALDSILYNTALERLYERLRGGLDLSVSLAEAGTTRRMLSSQIGLTEFVRRLPRRKRMLDLLLGSTRMIGDKWLQWQYGWRPLISDLYNSHDEAVRYVVNKRMTYRASATEKFSDEIPANWTLWSRAYAMPTRLWGKYGYRFVCTYTLPTETTHLDRWTSLNPVSIAWELLPYSFVADWIIDVGGYLRSLESALLYGTRFESGYYSRLRVYSSAARDNSYGVSRSGGSGTSKWDEAFIYQNVKHDSDDKEFQRWVLSSTPYPRAPRVDVRLGSERLLSAAALLRQKLRF